MTLVRPASPAEWSVARHLVEEYARSLAIDLGFQDFEHEIASLADEYGPPHGCFLLAVADEVCVGCGGLRRLSHSACELKRLYVVPAHRDRGVGRRIAEALISHARLMTYQTVMLDTLPSMAKAQHLYVALGFMLADPYRHNPVPGATFWRLDLQIE